MSDTNTKALIKKIFIRGEIVALTGLHIGGSNTSIDIGGVDTAVIRNPFNDEPYIPGSSLKGKMRSLLEQSAGAGFGRGAGKVKNGPLDDTKHPIVKIFGSAKGDDNNIPSKIIVRDCPIWDEDDELQDNQSTDLPFTEIKTEVMIDRLTAVASPRQIERVPAGASFKMEMVVNVWSDDIGESEMMEWIFNGMRLLQDDYLGGKGSRGSGQIKIHIDKIEERSRDFYLNTSGENSEKLYEPSQHTIPLDLQKSEE